MMTETRGLIMLMTGFALILYNAFIFLTSDNNNPVLFIIGIVFVGAGLNLAKKVK